MSPNQILEFIFSNLSLLRFDSKIAAPPIRNKQFASSIDLTCPWYMLELTDSMLRTRAKEELCTLRRSRASEIDKRPALQPIPERLKLLILLLNPNLLIIIVAKDGGGHTRLQFVMIMSALFGSILCLVNRSWTSVKSTISTSSIVELKEGSHGNSWTLVGKRAELGECLVPCST